MRHEKIKIWISLCFIIFSLCPLLVSQTTTETKTQSAVSQDKPESKKPEPALLKEIKTSQPDIRWTITFGKIFWATVLFFAALLLLKYLTQFLLKLSERWSKFRLAIKRLIPVIRVLGWALTILIIIEAILKPPIASLIAIAASVGIAVGLASQDILKNIFGGITILFDRPFQMGDKIEVSNYYGEVAQIGLRTVRIVTPDDSLVSIPNSLFLTQSVSDVNAGESYCQVVAEFFLPPDIDLIKTKKIAYRAAAVSRYVYLNKPIEIVLKNEVHEGRSLIKMRLKAYVLDLRYEFPFSSEMTEIVIRELLKHKLVTPEHLSFVKLQYSVS